MLTSSGVQTLPKLGLIARPGSDYNNCDISSGSGGDSLSKAGLIIGPTLATFGVSNFSGAGGFDAIKRSDTAVLSLVDNIITVLKAVSK